MLTTAASLPRSNSDSPASIPFGQVLRQARMEAGLSYETLAERTRTSQSYLHRLEQGAAANPGRNLVIRLGIILYRDDIDQIDEFLKAARQLPLQMDR
jgi:transcriptional regulator with XRE-family HTH domain